MTRTAERLLYQLKSRGPQPAAVLAADCAVTAMGAHKQLQALQAQGLVAAQDEAASGRGRPKRIWRLTAAGHARFPDRHGDLAVQLIRLAATVLGPGSIDQLIAAREGELEAQYDAALAGLATLDERVARLVELRAAEGYMARVERQGDEWLLIEDHCPIRAAAASCQGFCRSELELFQRALGSGARLQRVEHLLAGGRRCAYRIQAAS